MHLRRLPSCKELAQLHADDIRKLVHRSPATELVPFVLALVSHGSLNSDREMSPSVGASASTTADRSLFQLLDVVQTSLECRNGPVEQLAKAVLAVRQISDWSGVIFVNSNGLADFPGGSVVYSSSSLRHGCHTSLHQQLE